MAQSVEQGTHYCDITGKAQAQFAWKHICKRSTATELVGLLACDQRTVSIAGSSHHCANATTAFCSRNYKHKDRDGCLYAAQKSVAHS